jgi:hypothetical protein
MAKKKAKFDTSFNFGANAKPRKKAGNKSKGKKKTGNNRSWWGAYAGGKRR